MNLKIIFTVFCILMSIHPSWALDSEDGAIRSIKNELEKAASSEKFSGAVLIAKDGKSVFQGAYGFADREKNLTNGVDTKIHFGSMGKMFTGVAVLQLVEAGKLRLEDAVSKHLVDYPNKDVGQVTVYQLLTHTGGTGDIFSPEYEAHRKELQQLKDYVEFYGSRGLMFKPGSDWDYSNYGYILLGRIVEMTSGQTYADYVKEHIFKAAGMNSTGNSGETENVPNLAVCYTGPNGPGLRLMGAGPGPGGRKNEGGLGLQLRRPGGEEPAEGKAGADTLKPFHPGAGTSAGGGYSTVGDLLRFVNALQTHKLLNEKLTELLITGKVETKRPGMKYAFGFEDDAGTTGVRSFGHGGGSPGMNGRLLVYPKSNYAIVALANIDPPAADTIARFISNQLPLK